MVCIIEACACRQTTKEILMLLSASSSCSRHCGQATLPTSLTQLRGLAGEGAEGLHRGRAGVESLGGRGAGVLRAKPLGHVESARRVLLVGQQPGACFPPLLGFQEPNAPLRPVVLQLCFFHIPRVHVLEHLLVVLEHGLHGVRPVAVAQAELELHERQFHLGEVAGAYGHDGDLVEEVAIAHERRERFAVRRGVCGEALRNLDGQLRVDRVAVVMLGLRLRHELPEAPAAELVNVVFPARRYSDASDRAKDVLEADERLLQHTCFRVLTDQPRLLLLYGACCARLLSRLHGGIEVRSPIIITVVRVRVLHLLC
mmetsp:Transcript_40256/g.125941  ORF Transcript_40256/g.125941 Transcript_40256/m.125941 type:complete len:314 (-) Transcript_40256:2659-3600(-)